MENQIKDLNTIQKDNRTALTAIVFYFFTSYIGAIILGVAFLIFTQIFTDTNIDELSTNMWFQLFTNISIYIILTVGLLIIYAKQLKNDIKEIFSSISNLATLVLFVIIGYVVYLTSISVINVIINLFAETGDSANQEGIEGMFSTSPVLIFFMVVLMAPVVEELVFRKAVFGAIKNTKIAFVVSSLLFGLIHFLSSLLTGNFSDLINISPYIAMGIIFSTIYILSNKNAIYPIGLHMLSNFIAFLAMLVMAYT